MRAVLTRLALRTWHASVGALLARRGAPHLPILLYHGIVQEPTEPPCGWHLPVETFRRQMAYVAQNYEVLHVDDALARLAAGDLPPRACAITFDDGLRNNLTVAAPVLRELGLPATFYVVTERVGTPGVLWADQVFLACARTRSSALDARALDQGVLPLSSPERRARAAGACLEVLKTLPVAEKDAQVDALLAALGVPANVTTRAFELLDWDEVRSLASDPLFRVAAHGAHHEMLSRLSDDLVEAEVRGAQERLTRELGEAPRTFAYPNGRSQDFDVRAQAALRKAGVAWALTTEPHRARRTDAPLAVPRLNVDGGLSFLRFRMLLAGTLGALRRLRD